jgi:hypothetical protein
MALRTLLVGLIVVATALFVIGVAIERSSDTEAHHETAGAKHEESSGEGREGTERSELRPLGIDVEAWPFVVLAAAVALGLALGAWLRPDVTWLMWVLAIAMLAFAVLDVREVAHQLDVDEAGLAVLAGAVAVLHAAAALVAARMALRARQALDGGATAG